jgi:Immunity protein 8
MVIPELRSLFSPDLEEPETPSDPENCQVYVQALIGPKGEKGEESFGFTVATPSALEEKGIPRWGHGLLLVRSFSWTLVRQALDQFLMHCHAEDWNGVAQKLGRHTDWEFHNYKDA